MVILTGNLRHAAYCLILIISIKTPVNGAENKGQSDFCCAGYLRYHPVFVVGLFVVEPEYGFLSPETGVASCLGSGRTSGFARGTYRKTLYDHWRRADIFVAVDCRNGMDGQIYEARCASRPLTTQFFTFGDP